jgi:hypothetical protein
MNFYDFVFAFDFTFEGNVHIFFIYINYTQRFSHKNQPNDDGEGRIREAIHLTRQALLGAHEARFQGAIVIVHDYFIYFDFIVYFGCISEGTSKQSYYKDQNHVKVQATKGKITKDLMKVAAEDK